jgi:hypothetical protein
MTQRYSLRDFFRQRSDTYLAHYFAARAVVLGFDRNGSVNLNS